MIDTYLPKIPKGQVRTFLCPDAAAVSSLFETAQTCWAVEQPLVAAYWERLPYPEAIIDRILHGLAEITLALWPSWYGQPHYFCVSGNRLEDAISNRFAIQKLQATGQAISSPWLKAAVRACQADKLPLLKRFPRSVQLAQLALTLQPDALIFILALSDLHPQTDRLLGLAKATVWLAQETKARVGVLLPSDLSDHQELETIFYEAITLSSRSHPVEEKSPQPLRLTQGKPHHLSYSEQLLAQKLSQDAELGPLFHFNQTVRTVRDRMYRVDLLWPAGQMVVEVDGYQSHGSRFAFREDRHRDYELLISGYVVVRLSDHEIQKDVDIALDKIRDVVRFRRRTRSNEQS